MNDYTEVFTNRLTVNFMRKMVHRVGACTGNTELTLAYMSGLYFQEESTGIQY